MTDAHGEGVFITLEGGEGAGKSTQAKRIAAFLEARGVEAVLTREPGGTPLAEAARAMILSGGAKAYGEGAEAALFYAARLDHLERRIRPALARGAFVVCDRFSDSTRVYQGYAGQVDMMALDSLERIVVGSTKPDLTFILDAPVALGLARAAARRGNDTQDRFESQHLRVHEQIRQGFLSIAAQDPERCLLIDASVGPEEIFSRIKAALSARFPDRLGVGEPLAAIAREGRGHGAF